MVPVCIFAKPPVAGLVKTRLAAVIGTTEAAELAAAMLRDVWNTVSACAGACAVLAVGAEGDFPLDVPHADRWLQCPGDLGERIESILRRGIEQAPAAIAVGADSPLLTAAHVSEAIAALQNHDAVIGRCEDGGFYLLGMRACPPGLLAEIPWSSSDTAQAVACRITRNGGRLAEITTLFDVDTPADLSLLEICLESSPVLAPETHAFLARLRAQQPR